MAAIAQTTIAPSRPLRRRAPLEFLRRGDFAVLVNSNARGFKTAERAGAFEGISSDDIYLSRSLEHSDLLTRELIDKGYKAIFAAGGDGTVSHLLNEMRAIVPDPRRQPQIGIIRMGTGNALADYAGADTVVDDLRRLARGTQVERVSASMVETEGTLAPFAGCGVDAAILNDYIKLKETVSNTPLSRPLTGVQGYFAAALSRTLPEMMRPSSKRRVFVVNEGPVAYAVNRHGDVVDTFRRGAVLYSGDVLMAGVGSIPYFGYKLRMYPSSTRLPGFFQVRISDMSPLVILPRIGKIWRGQVDRRQGVYDFLAQKVRFEFDSDIPFQIAGDAAGYRREVTMRVADRSFDFIRPVDTAAEIIAHPAASGWFGALGEVAA